MAELKTKPTHADVDAFLTTLDVVRQQDSRTLVALIHELSDVDADVLRELVSASVAQLRVRYPD